MPAHQWAPVCVHGACVFPLRHRPAPPSKRQGMPDIAEQIYNKIKVGQGYVRNLTRFGSMLTVLMHTKGSLTCVRDQDAGYWEKGSDLRDGSISVTAKGAEA
jgi:hypothetical protein